MTGRLIVCLVFLMLLRSAPQLVCHALRLLPRHAWWWHCWGGTNSTGRRSGEARHSRVVLVIVADDHNVAADMFWLTGIDAGPCSVLWFSNSEMLWLGGWIYPRDALDV